MMNVNVVKLDPSGNITLFVLSPVPVDDRRELNDALLSADPDAEQAGCLSGSGRPHGSPRQKAWQHSPHL